MRQIFRTLAAVNALALAASFVTGVMSQWRASAAHPQDNTYLVHFLLGLFTAIGTLFAHCIIFTYLLGTGRWVKEVKIAYRLPDEPYPKLTRELKRQTFPPALGAMLITIAVAAAGYGTQLRLMDWPWQLHAALAIVALGVNLWAFRIEDRNIGRNTAAVEAVRSAAERIRAEHGLPPSE